MAEDFLADRSYEQADLHAFEDATQADDTPPSQLLTAFAALHQKVQALASALAGAGPQHMSNFRAELEQLEREADELMDAAQTLPHTEKQAAGDRFLIITDAINVAQLKLEML